MFPRTCPEAPGKLCSSPGPSWIPGQEQLSLARAVCVLTVQQANPIQQLRLHCIFFPFIHLDILLKLKNSHPQPKNQKHPSPPKAAPNLKPAKILSAFEISFKVCDLASKLGMHEIVKDEQMMCLYKSTFIKKTGLEILVEACW